LSPSRKKKVFFGDFWNLKKKKKIEERKNENLPIDLTPVEFWFWQSIGH
jgi:hypothetical protein